MNIYVLSDAKEFSIDGANFVTLDSPRITRGSNFVTIDPKDGTAPVTVFPATETVTIDNSTAANPYTPFALVRALKTAFPKGNSALPSSSGILNKTTAQRDAIVNPDAGTIIYNTTTGLLEIYEDSIWAWIPFGWQQQGINKYIIDAARSFYTANGDTYFVTGTANSGGFTSGSPAGSTSEASSCLIMNTNALATGRCFITSGSGTIIFGSGLTMLESRFLIPVLSNSTDRFVVFSGFNGSTTSNDMDNGMGILYDEGGVSTGSTASPNFQLVTAVNSVRTFNPTSIPVVANTWYRVRVLIAGDGSWIRYYINDVLVNPGNSDVTTNIPTTSVRATRMNVFLSKVLGTTSRLLYVNTVRFRQKYTNPR